MAVIVRLGNLDLSNSSKVEETARDGTWGRHLGNECAVVSVTAADSSAASVTLRDKLLRSYFDTKNLENRNFKVKVFFPNRSHFLSVSDIHTGLSPDFATLILHGGVIDKLWELDPSFKVHLSANVLLKSTKPVQTMLEIRPYTLRHLDVLKKENFSTMLLTSLWSRSNQFKQNSVVLMKPLNMLHSNYYNVGSTWTVTLEDLTLATSPSLQSGEIQADKANSSINATQLPTSAVTSKILRQEICSDFVLASSNGEKFKCHKNFLAAQSEFFKALIKNGQQTFTSDLGSPSLAALLEYIYNFDTEAPRNNHEIVFDLLKAGDTYKIGSLTEVIKSIYLEWPEKWESDVDIDIRLFVFAKDVSGLECLKKKAVERLKEKGRKMMTESESFSDLIMTDKASAMELCLCLSE